MADHGLCPRCLHANPPENRFCGSCGASLEASNDIIACRENNLAVRDHVLPARLGYAGKAVALGLAMLGAEVGLSWLRHRTKAEDRPSPSTTQEAFRDSGVRPSSGQRRWPVFSFGPVA